MIVTIMYRNNWFGGDGWTYYPVTVEIRDYCPVCGAKRGEPQARSYCEDGEHYTVDNWTNPCGHVDTYGMAYRESLRLKEIKEQNIARQASFFR